MKDTSERGADKLWNKGGRRNEGEKIYWSEKGRMCKGEQRGLRVHGLIVCFLVLH